MARKREDKDISLSKNNPQTVMPQGALGGRTKGKRQKNVLGPQPGFHKAMRRIWKANLASVCRQHINCKNSSQTNTKILTLHRHTG